jgi:superfamily II DNA or RNA helicase
MYYSSAKVDIELGNMLSRVSGDVPSGQLEKVFNRHLPDLARHAGRQGVRIFDADTGRCLTGLVPALMDTLDGLGIRTEIHDSRPVLRRQHDWRLQPHITLRDYQQEVVTSTLARDRGIVAAGTGAGKTVIGAALIARLGVPAIWVTTSRVLLEQAVRDLRDALGYEPGVCGAGRWSPADVTVALVQTLERRPDAFPPGRFPLLIFDEGHHAAARTYCATCLRLEPRRSYYLTAVPYRESEDQVVLEALTGGVVASVPSIDLIEKGWLCPLEVELLPLPMKGKMAEQRFVTLYRRFIVENYQRNVHAVTMAERYADQGHAVLVLVAHLDHGRRLVELLGEGTPFAHGRLPRRKLAAMVEDFAAGRMPILVATVGLFAEGVNIVGTSCIVYAAGMRSRIRTLQAVGRGMRPAPGKTVCVYCDFLDQDPLGRFLAHSRRRREVLAEAGFAVPPDPTVSDPVPDELGPRAAWTPRPGGGGFLKVRADGHIVDELRCREQPHRVPRHFCRICPDAACPCKEES